MIDVASRIGTHDVLIITIDTLRYDAARDALNAGMTPNLQALLPGGVWEERHSPGSFTYASHQAFFAGFLPSPVATPKHPRPFATKFPGSETIDARTCVFDAPDIVTGIGNRGYHTACVGGVGFFNKLSPLGSVLPNLFAESHWSSELGVTNPRSTENQVKVAVSILERVTREQRVFLFLNISAVHQPNHFYLDGATQDTIASHRAALAYVDAHLPTLFQAIRRRGPTVVIICSDHGTAYGEDGYWGHRLAHPVVWTVPYAEFLLTESTP